MSEVQARLSTQAMEDYLKAIYSLQQDNEVVSNNSIAQAVGTSPAATTKMVKQLAENRLIDHAPYQGVRLTPAGEKIALEIVRHHRLIELYLHEALGYDWDQVHAEAEKLEHHISEEFEARIDKLLNFPLHDPHGDPIPMRDGTIAAPRGTALDIANEGELLVISRVRDSSSEALRFLHQLGMRLGTVVEVLEKQPFNGPITLKIGDKTQTIGRELAGHVFVESCASLLAVPS